MNLTSIKNHVKNISGVAQEEALNSAIFLAAQEVWDSTDLPGTTQEIRVKVPTNYAITLPWQVYKIRGVMNPYNKLQVEINTIHPAYHDMVVSQSDYTWRVLRYMPLQSRITNASVLTFTLRAAESVDITLSIVGTTDLASRAVERVVIPAGALMSSSIYRYIGILEAIHKDRPTLADIDIYSADGVLLGVFPNFLAESRYILVQIHDRSNVSSVYTDAADVAFKPHMPALEDDADVFPDPYSQLVIFKSLEQLKLPAEDQLQVAAAYNDKSVSLLGQFSEDATRGVTLKPNFRANPFVTRYSVPI